MVADLDHELSQAARPKRSSRNWRTWQAPPPPVVEEGIGPADLEDLQKRMEWALSTFGKNHDRWHRLALLANTQPEAKGLFGSHFADVHGHFVQLAKVLDIIESINQEHTSRTLFTQLGRSRRWYRGFNIFDTNLSMMCELLDSHPIPADDIEDFAQYTFQVLEDPANRLELDQEPVEWQLSDGTPATDSLSERYETKYPVQKTNHFTELITRVLAQTIGGHHAAIFYAFHASILLLLRLSAMGSDWPASQQLLLRLIPFMDDMMLLHGIGKGPLRTRSDLPSYWNFATASRRILKAFEAAATPGRCLIERFNPNCHIEREFVLQSLEQRVAQLQSCLSEDYCRKHRYLNMLHTYQRLAWEEIQRNTQLAARSRLPPELTEVIFEHVLELEGIPQNPCVFVRVDGGGAPVVGDLVTRAERYSVHLIRQRAGWPAQRFR